MKKATRFALLSATLLGCGLTALAQDAPKAPTTSTTTTGSPDGPRVMQFQTFFGSEPGREAVKNAPYSADSVTETVQVLGDGNRIVRKNSSKTYRDSAGRVRREVTPPFFAGLDTSASAPSTTVTISDPETQSTYILQPANKTARKMTRPTIDFKRMQADMAKGGTGQIDRNETVTRQKDAKGNIVEKHEITIIRRDANGKETRETIQVDGPPHGMPPPMGGFGMGPGMPPPPPGGPGMRPPMGGPGAPPPPPPGDGNVFMFNGFGEQAKPVVESLGTQTIEGVEAEGKRTTFTIPAGKIGNERDIVIVDEEWYAPSLQLKVLTKHSDPRSGETTFRLTNISRSEPDKSLFEVPGDYKVTTDDFGPRMRMPKP